MIYAKKYVGFQFKMNSIASAIDFFEHFLCSNTEIQVLVLASPLPENCTSILNLGVDRGHYNRLIRHKYLKMRPSKKIFLPYRSIITIFFCTFAPNL